MGFLETIGQRKESAPQGSRPAAAQDLIWDDSAKALEPAPAPEPKPRRSNRASPAIWIAALLVVAAVSVAAWLGIRKSATHVAPPPAASADAPAVDQTHVDKPQPKRTSTHRREVVQSAVNHARAIDTKASDGAVDPPTQTSGSDAVAPVVNVAETAASPAEPVSDSTPALVAELPEDNFIYSSDGTGVVAPQLVSLGFSPPLVKGFQARTTALELIVSKSGTVERAKISATSTNWEDAMLLSRAKMFQFVPAQRDGYPVRYRLLMRVDATP